MQKFCTLWTLHNCRTYNSSLLLWLRKTVQNMFSTKFCLKLCLFIIDMQSLETERVWICTLKQSTFSELQMVPNPRLAYIYLLNMARTSSMLEATCGNLLVHVGQLAQGVLWDDVATHQTHGRVGLCALLPQDGAGKDGVEVVLVAKVNLHLQNH